jgi:hypothetical protein
MADYVNSVFDLAIRTALTSESAIMGDPISQLVELSNGMDTKIPQTVSKLTPNIENTKNFLFIADMPATKPNAKVAIANTPKDKK